MDGLFERDQDGAVLAFADMMKKQIVMPAHLMDDGEHETKTGRNLFTVGPAAAPAACPACACMRRAPSASMPSAQLVRQAPRCVARHRRTALGRHAACDMGYAPLMQASHCLPSAGPPRPRPPSQDFSSVAEKTGTYTAMDYADIMDHLIVRWNIPGRQGLSGDAAGAQDYLVKLPNRIRRLTEKAQGERAPRGRCVCGGGGGGVGGGGSVLAGQGRGRVGVLTGQGELVLRLQRAARGGSPAGCGPAW